jgi:RNA polymerase sigma factor (sigma-70 family)
MLSAASRLASPAADVPPAGTVRIPPVYEQQDDSVEGRPLEDAQLVDRARNGDVTAYEELMHRHQVLAQRVAFLACGNAPDAEDAVQEAFVKAYYALGRFREGAEFRPWLLAIVTNEARNRVRASGRRARLAVRAGEVRPSDGAAPSSEEAALASAEKRRLLDALDGLREEDRLVISMRYLLELSEHETATALGLPKGTVKSRLSRALVRLRERMRETAEVSQ